MNHNEQGARAEGTRRGGDTGNFRVSAIAAETQEAIDHYVQYIERLPAPVAFSEEITELIMRLKPRDDDEGKVSLTLNAHDRHLLADMALIGFSVVSSEFFRRHPV